MKELKIVAVIEVKEVYKDELMNVFKETVDATRKEEGSISYELFEDVKNPLKFTFIEHWASKEAIEEHNASAHFQRFVAAIEGKVDNLAIDVLKKMY